MPITMKTVSETYAKAQAKEVTLMLIEESRRFQVEPEPYDTYRITIRAERTLPAPVGVDGTGAPVTFDAWFETVEREYETLTAEAKAEFRDLFVRGLTPAEAVQHDHENAD